MSDSQTTGGSNATDAPVTQQGETSTDISPVSRQGNQSQPAQGGQDATEAPEEDNKAQPSGDPRPYNQGQPEQPDARG